MQQHFSTMWQKQEKLCEAEKTPGGTGNEVHEPQVRSWRGLKSVSEVLGCVEQTVNICRNLCRDEDENQDWMIVIFGPSGATALKPDVILLKESLHVCRNTSENHCQWAQLNELI